MIDSLTPQQLEGIDFIKNHNYRCLVADSAGSGKTYMLLSALEQKNYPCLVICIKVGLPVWKNELLKWFNEPSIIYAGTPKQREELKQRIKNEKSKFVIATYAMFDELIDVMGLNYFKTVILDEYHMYGLLNRKTNFFKSTDKLCKIIPYWLPTTGSPQRSTPADFYPALHLLDPNNKDDGLTAYWNFVDKYCIKIKGFFGFEIERMPRSVEGFRTLLNRFMLRRTLDDLPEKIRQPLIVEMSTQQRKLYEQLKNEMKLETEQGCFLLTPNQMTNILRIRQILVTPKILGVDCLSGGLEATIEQTKQELSEDNSVIIFTPFAQAIPYIAEELQKECPDTIIIPIHGGFSVKQYEEAQNNFQALKTKNKVIICTIKSGASITLTEANVCIFLGYEWSAIENLQAESRSHRKTQTKSVRCFYILYENTPDELILNRLNEKQLSIDVCMDQQQYFQKLLDTNT
jgi:SNF2 family DNA or RNA helicase